MRRHQTPDAINPRHRNRMAVGYVRLDEHPTTPRESAYRDQQRDQLHHAEFWGWPITNVLAIEDLGRCGCSHADRGGYRDLLQMIRAGHVGLVLVSDFDRLATAWDDVVELLALCATTDTLLAVDGVLADCADPTANVALRLRSVHTQYTRQEEALLTEVEEMYAAVRADR